MALFLITHSQSSIISNERYFEEYFSADKMDSLSLSALWSMLGEVLTPRKNLSRGIYIHRISYILNDDSRAVSHAFISEKVGWINQTRQYLLLEIIITLRHLSHESS